jgi:hypothetical protein
VQLFQFLLQRQPVLLIKIQTFRELFGEPRRFILERMNGTAVTSIEGQGA